MNITGPKVYFRIPVLGGIPITETIVNMWIVMLAVTFLCLWLGHGLKDHPESKKQVVTELIITKLYSLVKGTMGEKNTHFAPYIGTLFTMTVTGSLISLIGLRPYTGDLSVTLSWAIITFVMIQYSKVKSGGIKGYFKGFVHPTPVLLPINIISEIATPVSMAFRLFGNIASGIVISALIYMALAGLSTLVLKFIPDIFLSSIPIFQLGIPAFLSIYFDLWTGFLQGYIFCMLTMVYVSSSAEE